MKKLKNDELNRLSVDEFKRSDKTPIVVVLDNVRSLNNIGSVFRTADAFRVEAIYLCGITATPPNKEINKTALGACDTVAWKYFSTIDEAVEELMNANVEVCAIEQAEGSVMLSDYDVPFEKKIGLIFGNEVNGVSESAMMMANKCLEIPQLGSKHSLNVAVSAGIVIWDIQQKILKKHA